MPAAANLTESSATTARARESRHDMFEQASPDSKLFKRHKVLPHPSRRRHDGRAVSLDARSLPRRYDLSTETVSTQRSASQRTQSPTPNPRSRRVRSGPAMPPTPPTHSRTSSSSHSIQQPSSPTFPGTPPESQERVQIQSDRPATPPNQTSPPTPDVTPPQPDNQPRALRPVFGNRSVSKTMSESRTESFRTAREEPYSSSGEDDSRSTIRPRIPSTRTSQNTVRQVSDTRSNRSSRPLGLGLNMDAGTAAADDDLTPRTKREFVKFDGDWISAEDVEQQWDDNLGRHVTVRKLRNGSGTPETPRSYRQKMPNKILDDKVITPSDATRALRSMPLDRPSSMTLESKDRPTRKGARTRSSTTSDARSTPDDRRHSTLSTKSNVSTVVEAVLVDSPTPQRQQTLRHVKKRGTLRDSGSEASPSSSALSSSIRLEDSPRRPRPWTRPSEGRHQSYTSTTTNNSISSNKARREVWKSGAIPVVVVPDRRSSAKTSQTPSLRSMSSRRTDRSRSMSVGSVPRVNGSRSGEATPIFPRPNRRGRTRSESDGSDQRTIDFPPAIPARSSSLSAPTSRNTSRAGSMTTESLKSRSALEYTPHIHDFGAPPEETRRPPSFESGGEELLTLRTPNHQHLDIDHHGDPFFGRRLSAQNTPFSAASWDTNGTAPEVSEAMAVSIFPHQNSSVLMVDHLNKPSEASFGSQKNASREKALGNPKIIATAPGAVEPVTPPQPHFPAWVMDSPLRNPRSPPEPPAIQFIPATPSGLTPNDERQEKLGNYFDAEIDEPRPRRSTSLVRRAFSRRHHSDSYPPSASRTGFLSRTFSLSRYSRKESDLARERSRPVDRPYPTEDDPPAEGNKLHPFWRPAYSEDEDDDDDRYYRYPPIDNRPSRSLSSRMKKTFAILPLDYDEYSESLPDGTEQRTIRRTSSGNLRVMRKRRSAQSLRARTEYDRPATAPEGASHSQLVWTRGRAKELQPGRPTRRRRFSVSNTVEELQGLSRRLSERRREKRTQELRQKISGPREVRDNIGDVIRRASYRDNHQQTNLSINHQDR